MILLVVIGVVTGSALLTGGLLARRRAASQTRGDREAASVVADDSGRGLLEGFPCQLGDVVVRVTGEEAWLASAVVFLEGAPVAALFIAPDAPLDRAVYVRLRASGRVQWLSPVDAGVVLSGSGDAPAVVEHEALRFERVRRLPLRARSVGKGAPVLTDTVMVSEYESPGAQRLLVLHAGQGRVLAYWGTELPAGTFDIIGSGARTL